MWRTTTSALAAASERRRRASGPSAYHADGAWGPAAQARDTASRRTPLEVGFLSGTAVYSALGPSEVPDITSMRVESFWGDAWDFIVSGVDAVVNLVVSAVSNFVAAVKSTVDTVIEELTLVVTYINNGIKTVTSFIMDTAGKVFEFVGLLMKKLGVDLGAMLDWLKSLFGWDDILRTHQAIVSAVNEGLTTLQNSLTNLQSDASTFFETSRAHLFGFRFIHQQARARRIGIVAEHRNAAHPLALLASTLNVTNCTSGRPCRSPQGVASAPHTSAIPWIMVGEYKGRVAVITGAASGLGLALATELAVQGCNLALIDIDSAALARTRSELARPGIVVTDHFADVSSEQNLEFVAAEVKKIHRTVHLLINNAGVSGSASFLKTQAPEFDRIIRINFFGAVYGCRVFLPLLQEHSQGQILNVSSCFAWLGYPRKTAYASSKGALRAFSESLRLEICESGVGVTVLYPGPLHTSLVRSGFRIGGAA